MYQLRELERRDLTEINRWRNNPELISLLGAPYRYINQEVDEKWFENYMANRNHEVRCAITETDKESILGLISLVKIDQINQSAELHIMIGCTENQNRGIGTFAVSEMLRHAFLDMNLQRIELQVLASNERAQHLYQKVGFIQEGIKRNARYKTGKFEDMLLFSILKNEWSDRSCQ